MSTKFFLERNRTGTGTRALITSLPLPAAPTDELSAMEYREANEQQEAMDKHKAELFSPSRARVFGSEGNLQARFIILRTGPRTTAFAL